MKRYRVVIRAFTLRRDLASAILLKHQLERLGCSVFLASSRNYIAVIKRWKPHAVLLSVESVVAPTRKILPKAVIALWHGEGGEPLEGSDAMTVSRNPGLIETIDRVFTFGERGKGFYDRLFPSIEPKWIVAGNPRLELAKFNPVLRESGRRSDTIGIPCRFSGINQCEGYPVFRTLDNPDSEWEIVHQARSYAALVRMVDRVLSDTDLRISLRPHPTENPASYRYLKRRNPDRIEVDTTYDFSTWCAGLRAVVGPSTTSILEAYVLRVPAINIEAMAGVGGTYSASSKIFADLVTSQSSSYVPKTLDELIDLLRSDLPPRPRNREIDEALRNVHNWYSPKSATTIVSDELVRLIRSRRRNPKLYLPKALVHVEDAARFARGWFNNRLITNFNFQYGYHDIPSYYSTLVDNARAGRRLDPSLT